MWALAAAFPRQLRDGLRSVPRHDFALRPGVPVAVAGMGGSGIAGELLASLASRESETPLLPVRGSHLPTWVRPPVPLVAVSYSGDTAETLASFEEAGRRGVERAVVASGGRLGELAKKEGLLQVQVPGGQPPRASLGYLMGALAGVLREALPGTVRDLPRASESLDARAEEFSGGSGRPRAIAEAWGGARDLWVYAPDALAAVARRWKTQAEENAKVLSHFDTFPELLHNAIVPWEVLAPERARDRFVVLLRGGGEGPEADGRAQYLERALREKGVGVETYASPSRGALAELLDLLWAADYVTLWSARLRGVDPVPIMGIDRMKRTLSAPPAARAARV